jgi:allantoin racemase
MKIRVIIPSITKEFEAMGLEQYSPGARLDTEISVTLLDKGPASIESRYEETVAAPDIVKKVVEAEQDGMDAVIVDCMAEPGVQAAREVVSIPVIGIAETAMRVASMLGHRFSVITVLDRAIPRFERHGPRTGLGGRIASLRAVNIPVLEMGNTDRLVEALIEQSALAVREDGAHVVVFGCTGMAGLSDAVESGLEALGISDVPVIDPTIVAVKVAEALVDLGLSHSKKTYPTPPEKEILGYSKGLSKSVAGHDRRMDIG